MSVSTFNPAADTMLDGGNTATNYGTEPVMILSAFGGAVICRGIWRFNLTAPSSGSAIAIGATINSAQLVFSGADKTAKTINTSFVHFYRGTQSWVENQATWLNYATGLSWASAGGAPDTGIADEGVAEEGGIVQVAVTNLTADAVANRSRILQLVGITEDEESLGILLESREGEVPPLLTVDWTAPPPPSAKPAAHYYSSLLSRPRC